MAKRSLELKFRGYSNQRIIDVPESLARGREPAEHPVGFLGHLPELDDRKAADGGDIRRGMGLLFYHKFQWEFNRCASSATRSTSTMLYNEGTENGAEAMVDEIQMRSKAVVSGIPITTTIAALTSTVEGLEDRLAFNSGCYKTPKAGPSHGNSAKASLPSLTRDKHDFGRFESL